MKGLNLWKCLDFNLNRSIKWREYLAGGHMKEARMLYQEGMGGLKEIEGKLKKVK